MTRLIACGIALVVLSGPASACINDKELPGHEREFRSNYNGRPPLLPVAPENPPSEPEYSPTFGAGAGLLVVSAGLVLFRRRPKG